MTQAEQLAAFAGRASYDMLSEQAREQIKIRVLDSLGCAIGALEGDPVRAVRAQVDEFGGTTQCTLIGGGHSSLDRAALYNTALVRYLDFMDFFLATGETCHPSCNVGSVLAASEYAGAAGRDVLAALALAYQVQCRLTETAPLMQRGFDHTAQMCFSVAAGVSRVLSLDERQTANALALCGTQSPALVITRASPTTQWKGLASSAAAQSALLATDLARRGVTGPLNVFEGTHGFEQAIGERVDIDWTRETLEAVTRTDVKAYNSEAHSQSAVEGLLDLRQAHGFAGSDIARIAVGVFQTAYDIIGGGAYGDRIDVATKEQADHSLPYVLAVAALDGEVTPAQYLPARMRRADVQELLRTVSVAPVDDDTRHYPQEMRCHVAVTLKDGRTVLREKRDYAQYGSVKDFGRCRIAPTSTPFTRKRGVHPALHGLLDGASMA